MFIKENVNYPYEGYFWISNNKVVGITAEVPHNIETIPNYLKV